MKPRRGLRRILWAPIAVGLLLWLCPVAATAGSAFLSWDINAEADLAGYKIYIGPSPGTYTQTINVPNPNTTTFTVSALSPGETYFFALKAYDIFSNHGDYSNVVSKTIPEPQPDPNPEPQPEPAPEPAPEPEPDNSPPSASFTFSCSDLVCSFTNTSTDFDGSVVARSWDFGEGASSIENNPVHTYASDGTYNVSLVATDDYGATDTTSQGVIVTSSSGTEPPPEPTCQRGKSCNKSKKSESEKGWGKGKKK